MNILERLFSYLFPDSCVGCRAPRVLLCSECEKTIRPAERSKYKEISSTFSFSDKRIQRLVWMLKYKNARRVADILGKKMVQSLEKFLVQSMHLQTSIHCILVPIPLSKERLRERGYNQSELLSYSMLKHRLSLSMRVETQVLLKEHDTFAQAKVKQRTVRQRNISNCFSVIVGKIPVSSTIVLVDDVTTTGVTILEAKKALNRAGYNHVYAQTAAH